MNYLELTCGQLACQFSSSTGSLLDTFEQLFAVFEQFKLGDENFICEDSYLFDEDFFTDDPQSLLMDIENAIQIARLHSDEIAQFCEGIDKGRGPSMEDGIRLISLVQGGKKPSKSMLAEWISWELKLQNYVEFFTESQIVAFVLKESRLAKEQGETASVSPIAAANSATANETKRVEADSNSSVVPTCYGDTDESPLDRAKRLNLPYWDSDETTLYFRCNQPRKYRGQLKNSSLFDALQSSDWKPAPVGTVIHTTATDWCKSRTSDNRLGLKFQYDRRTKTVTARWDSKLPELLELPENSL